MADVSLRYQGHQYHVDAATRRIRTPGDYTDVTHNFSEAEVAKLVARAEKQEAKS